MRRLQLSDALGGGSGCVYAVLATRSQPEPGKDKKNSKHRLHCNMTAATRVRCPELANSVACIGGKSGERTREPVEEIIRLAAAQSYSPAGYPYTIPNSRQPSKFTASVPLVLLTHLVRIS